MYGLKSPSSDTYPRQSSIHFHKNTIGRRYFPRVAVQYYIYRKANSEPLCPNLQQLFAWRLFRRRYPLDILTLYPHNSCSPGGCFVAPTVLKLSAGAFSLVEDKSAASRCTLRLESGLSCDWSGVEFGLSCDRSRVRIRVKL